MNDILNPGPSSSSLDEEEKEDKKYYISKKILKRYNNLGEIFKIELAKKKRGRKKKQKKLNIMLGLKKIL